MSTAGTRASGSQMRNVIVPSASIVRRDHFNVSSCISAILTLLVGRANLSMMRQSYATLCLACFRLENSPCENAVSGLPELSGAVSCGGDGFALGPGHGTHQTKLWLLVQEQRARNDVKGIRIRDGGYIVTCHT